MSKNTLKNSSSNKTSQTFAGVTEIAWNYHLGSSRNKQKNLKKRKKNLKNSHAKKKQTHLQFLVKELCICAISQSLDEDI